MIVIIVVIIIDNFCTALFSGIPKPTELYNILQHPPIIIIIMDTFSA